MTDTYEKEMRQQGVRLNENVHSLVVIWLLSCNRISFCAKKNRECPIHRVLGYKRRSGIMEVRVYEERGYNLDLDSLTIFY